MVASSNTAPHAITARYLPSAAAVYVAVGVATIGGALLRFLWLGKQSFWIDEVVTWNLLHHSLPSMVFHGVPDSESTPPLYYVAAWLWVRLFGWSETALRSLSALFGVLIIPVVYGAARALAGKKAAALTAFLVASSPILVWYSQEARAYSMFAFWSALSLLFFARLRQRYAVRDLVAWSVVAVFALATHYFALPVVMVEAGWLMRRTSRRQFLAALVAPSITCLLLAPYMYKQRSHAVGLGASAPLGTRLAQSAGWFASGPLTSVLLWCLTGAVMLVALVFLAQGGTAARRGGIMALRLAATGIALPVLLALAGKDYVFFRNLIPFWTLLAIAVAAGLAVAPGYLGVAGAATLVGAFMVANVAVVTQPGVQRDYYRQVVAELPRASGTTIVMYPGWDVTPLEHYDPSLTPASAGRFQTREVDFVGVKSDFGAWTKPEDLRVNPPAGFQPAGALHIQRFLIQRYTAIRPVEVSLTDLQQLIYGRPGPRLPSLRVLIRTG